MNKNHSRIMIAGLLIAWLVDFLFYRKALGISFPIWITVVILAVFILGKLEQIKPSKLSYLLALSAVGLSLAPFFRQEPLTRFTTVLGSLFLTALLIMTFRNGFWFWFRLVDYVKQGLYFIGGLLVEAGKVFFHKPNQSEGSTLENQTEEQKKPQRSFKPFFAVVRGLLFAVPILLILSALLASADPIFEQNLKGFFDLFKIEHLPEYVFRLFYILVLAYFFISGLLYAYYSKHPAEKPNPDQSWFKPFLGNIETSIVLGSIAGLFAAFVMIQFQYFFGGTENITIEGYTFSEYARRGFGELVIVAVLSLGIYLVFHSVTKKQSTSTRRLFSVLSILIFAEVLVILLSSYYRLNLYETAYGFSRLRTYSHLFIPWLAFLILAVILMEITQKQGRFALLLLFTVTGFVTTLAISNIDGSIAQKNIQRGFVSDEEGYRLDVTYFSDLSNDAVPFIFDAYQQTTGEVHEELGRELACRWIDLQNEENHWQGFNLSQNAAQTILTTNEKLWQTYNPDLTSETLTVDGETYYCYYVWMD